MRKKMRIQDLIWKHTVTSLLHTTEWLIESHSIIKRSWPAVRNCGKTGWMARPHNSSVWPRTTGVSPNSMLPISMQFLVVPTSSCEPRPSATTRMGPVQITFLISQNIFTRNRKKFYSIFDIIKCKLNWLYLEQYKHAETCLSSQ